MLTLIHLSNIQNGQYNSTTHQYVGAKLEWTKANFKKPSKRIEVQSVCARPGVKFGGG